MAKAGWCVWVTGLPGSGKSVASEALLRLLDERGIRAQILSSDGLRKVLTPQPSYSLEEREILCNACLHCWTLDAEWRKRPN